MKTKAFIQEALAKLSDLLTESNGASPFDSRSDARRCAAYLVVLMAEAIKTDSALRAAFGDEIQVLRNTVAHAMTEDLIDSPGFKRYLLESFLPSSRAILAGQATSDVIGSIPRPDRPSEEDMVCNTRVLVKKISDETPADWIAQGARCYTMLSLTESFVQSTTNPLIYEQFKINDARKIRQQFSHPIVGMSENITVETVLQTANTFDARTKGWLAHVKGELLQEETLLTELSKRAGLDPEAIPGKSIERLQQEAKQLLIFYDHCQNIRTFIAVLKQSLNTKKLTLLPQKMDAALSTLKATLQQEPLKNDALESAVHNMAVILFNYIALQRVSALIVMFMDSFSSYLCKQEKSYVRVLPESTPEERTDAEVLTDLLSPLRVAACSFMPIDLVKTYFFNIEDPVTPDEGVVVDLINIALGLAKRDMPINTNVLNLTSFLLTKYSSKTLREIFTPYYLLAIALRAPHLVKLTLLRCPALKKAWYATFSSDQNELSHLQRQRYGSGECPRDYVFDDINESVVSSVTEILDVPGLDWNKTNALGDSMLVSFLRRLKEDTLLSDREASKLRTLSMHPKIDLFVEDRSGLSAIELQIENSTQDGEYHQALSILLEAAYERDPKRLFLLLDKKVTPSKSHVGQKAFKLMSAIQGDEWMEKNRVTLITLRLNIKESLLSKKSPDELNTLFFSALSLTDNAYPVFLSGSVRPILIPAKGLIELFLSYKRYELHWNTSSTLYTTLTNDIGMKAGEHKKALLKKYYESSRDAVATTALIAAQAGPSGTHAQASRAQPSKRKGKGPRKK